MGKIVTVCVCGAGEAGRYMEETLKNAKTFSDEILIVTNNATKSEKDLIKQYRVRTYEDNREWGLHQRALKERLHMALAQLNPDWVVALDMDERVIVTRADLDGLVGLGRKAWHFFLVDLWGDGYKPEMCFWKVQFYKYDKTNVAFSRWGFDPGLVPEWAASSAGYAPFYILHSGLIKPEDRARRLERYKRYDPDAKGLPQAYYDALASTEPPVPLDEAKLKKDLLNEYQKTYGSTFPLHQK